MQESSWQTFALRLPLLPYRQPPQFALCLDIVQMPTKFVAGHQLLVAVPLFQDAVPGVVEKVGHGHVVRHVRGLGTKEPLPGDARFHGNALSHDNGRQH